MNLEKHLAKIGDLDNVSMDLEKEHEGHKVKDIFCDNWDDARKVLQLMEMLIKNPIVRGIINIVIITGNSIARKVC